MQKIVHVSTETYKWMLYLKIQQSEDNNIVHITMLSVRKKNPAEAGRRKILWYLFTALIMMGMFMADAAGTCK